MLRDFELSDGAYSKACAYFLDRYDNGRAIVEANFRNSKNLPSVKNEMGTRQLLDVVSVIIIGLKLSGEIIESTFTSYTAYYVSIRPDSETAKDWKNSLKSVKSFPKYKEIKEFLKIRAFAVEDRLKEKKFQIR